MEVVAAAPPGGGGGPPFCDRNVREWARIDGVTGNFERARLETDGWAASVGDASYRYGKVVGSKNFTAADGLLRQSAKRQLEVFQGRVQGAQLHLVRTSSHWTSASSINRTGNGDFENLQLPLNHLDVTSQKSKASVGRSASRRPPTRQRVRDQPIASPLRPIHLSPPANRHRTSRLCHQIHETAVRQAFSPTIAERQDGDGRVEITEIEEEKDANSNRSVEDLEDLEQLQTWRRTSKLRRSLQFPKPNEQSESTELLDFPESVHGSVRRLREDLEKDRRLNTALRNNSVDLEKGRRLNTALRNNSVDLEALDQILRTISSSSTSSEKTTEEADSDTPTKQKKNSFVTVESIKEVKGRLRRTSSPSSDIYKTNGKDDDPDDGIVTEEILPDKEPDMPLMENSRVRSYVYGMEAMLNKKPGIGTGSLESRVKLVNGNATTNRSEDWYNRRKSYGFEQVHGHSESTNSISLRDKKLVESSTDSGICRSTEIVVVPTTRINGYTSDEQSEKEKSTGYSRIHRGQVEKLANSFVQDEKMGFQIEYPDDWCYPLKNELKSTTITIPIAKNNNVVKLSWTDPDRDTKRHSIAVDESKYVARKFDPDNNSYRRTSLAVNDEEDSNLRKTKKVEFCKTEVHFAAESGKVNIVATDEKPPPTQNFRRRRRNSGPTLEDFKNGLPIQHFGDSTYEKSMFGLPNDLDDDSLYENAQLNTTACGFVTVSTTKNDAGDATDDEKRDFENELKSILKNKPMKPIPYHLGQPQPLEEDKWGVKLRHVDTPIWKSSVSVRNYNYLGEQRHRENIEPEFQQLLKKLRPVNDTAKATRNSALVAEEAKGYSTKINFGEGEATVVKNNDNIEPDRPSTWLKTESMAQDSTKQLLQRGLVVRIAAPDHSTSSKMTSKTQKSTTTTTTTKITICNGRGSSDFKSPSMIMDVLEVPPEQLKLPPSRHLEILRRLYGDDAHSDDSEADKEVRLLMCKEVDDDQEGSEVSGSWGKMRACKNFEDKAFRSRVEEDFKDRHKPQYIPTKINVNQRQSPMAPRKTIPSSTRHRPSDLKPTEKLSSPSIVKRNKATGERDTKNQVASEGIVLRQPKTSEMTYFGVKPAKTVIREEHTRSSPGLKQKPSELRDSKWLNMQGRATATESPVYENIRNKYGATREFDSSILEELTKAADQILQAVNGYTDEDSHPRLTTEDEDDQKSNKNHLETIPETTKTTPASKEVKSARRRTDKAETGATKAATRARRLQRASSREALLQSQHGSSSEDLPAKVEMPLRKPRLVRKIKSTQLTPTDSLEVVKKSPGSGGSRRSKVEERILGSLPEIRHKTAVSTIRSTSEKVARDKSRYIKNEDVKKNQPQPKKETSRVSSLSSRKEKEKTNRQTTVSNKETVTHRISTANIKKCYRTNGDARH